MTAANNTTYNHGLSRKVFAFRRNRARRPLVHSTRPVLVDEDEETEFDGVIVCRAVDAQPRAWMIRILNRRKRPEFPCVLGE